jgi:hypothetical protein
MPATVRDIFRQFNPLESLGANDPRYVDCTMERGLPALFQSLRLPLEDSPRSFLFSGHLGDGKTTLLKQLQGQLEREERDFVAFGQADDRLDLGDVEYDDVLLTILAVVDQALRERFRAHMDANPFQRAWEELSRIAGLPVQLDKLELTLGPFGKLTTLIKDSPDTRLQVRQRLREASGTTFLGVVNDFLHQAQDIVHQHGHRQLVVILDNLDRLPEIQVVGNMYADERLFLGQATQLLGVQCHVIYTIRLPLVRAQEANLTNRYGQRPLVVPMVPVRWPDGTPHDEGLGRLQDIIQRRLEAAGINFTQAFTAMSEVDQLCRASGGHLRTLMILVRSACTEAQAAHANIPLTAADVNIAIRNEGAQRRMIAAGHTEALRHISQTHRLDGLPVEVQHALLNHRLVYEYFTGGDYWYDTSGLLYEGRARDGS